MTPCIERQNLVEYFREQVRSAMHHQGKELPEIVEFYLVNLLLEYSKNEKMQRHGETLALILARALEVDYETRVALLKHLGDISLYVSGFFPVSLSRKLVDIDYYVQMGETAYGTLSTLMERQSTFADIFGQLAERFVESMDILSEVSHQANLRNELGLLKIYETWLKTGSDRLKQLLMEEGIVPNPLHTLKLQ